MPTKPKRGAWLDSGRMDTLPDRCNPQSRNRTASFLIPWTSDVTMSVDLSLSATLAPGLTGYSPLASSYDEMCSTVGNVRPHWDYLIRSLEKLGAQELLRRQVDAKRLLRENGVTYNVYDDPRGMTRPWEFDLVPVLVTSQEWSTIERGLIQRAELLNLILADLYGPRMLIARGLLPPEVVYAHPGFLLPCTGLRPAGNRYLPLYCADLAR